MSTLTLNHPIEDAKILVKLAFENTEGVKTYNDSGVKIVGKTGFSLTSYGENVVVEIPEDQPNDDQTVVSVQSNKEVGMNVTANPQKYESRFLSALGELRGEDVNDLKERIDSRLTEETTKEVTSADDQVDGSEMLPLVILAVMVLMFFMFIMMIP